MLTDDEYVNSDHCPLFTRHRRNRVTRWRQVSPRWVILSLPNGHPSRGRSSHVPFVYPHVFASHFCLAVRLSGCLLIVGPCPWNRNRKLEISTAPRKAKSREAAYSQALVQIKIDRQRVKSRESGRQDTTDAVARLHLGAKPLTSRLHWTTIFFKVILLAVLLVSWSSPTCLQRPDPNPGQFPEILLPLLISVTQSMSST